jgi:hypothetical protein
MALASVLLPLLVLAGGKKSGVGWVGFSHRFGQSRANLDGSVTEGDVAVQEPTENSRKGGVGRFVKPVSRRPGFNALEKKRGPVLPRMRARKERPQEMCEN